MTAKTIGILQFPGSNCDVDCRDTLERHFKTPTKFIWHTETKLPEVSGLVVPGGFSYGDYLRSGALAAHSACMALVKDFASRGGPILGICNGFQILTEAGLLPGMLLQNVSRRFVCKFVHLVPEMNKGNTTYHKTMNRQVLRVPIAHGDGRYFIDESGYRRLVDDGQIVVRYGLSDGTIPESANPNGSVGNIAGICNKKGNVFGLMPHPERATDLEMGGSTDGLLLWRAFLEQAL